MRIYLVIVLLALTLAACKQEQAAVPDPVDITEGALSFFCQMQVAEHDGPKGQIHLQGYPQPIFFAQIRDLLAYLKSPERIADITAIYVSDFGAAQNWKTMGPGNWIAAKAAYFVIEAPIRGGMGAPEVVPFSEEAAARAFAERYKGRVVEFDAIPEALVLGPVDLSRKLETPS